MIDKLAAYSREMRFALSAPANPRSAARLLGRNLAFHLNQMPVRYGLWFCAPIERDDPFEVCLDLGYGQHRVLLGTHSGDLYVLARTFVQQYHAIPHSILESAEVGTIVDLGVNIGMASLAFHPRYPTARVIAVEPLEANYRLSCRNTEKIAAVVPIRAAVVGAPRATVWMTTSARAWGNKLATDRKAAAVEPVPSLTLDELLGRCGLDRVDMLKVDIESSRSISRPRRQNCSLSRRPSPVSASS